MRKSIFSIILLAIIVLLPNETIAAEKWLLMSGSNASISEEIFVDKNSINAYQKNGENFANITLKFIPNSKVEDEYFINFFTLNLSNNEFLFKEQRQYKDNVRINNYVVNIKEWKWQKIELGSDLWVVTCNIKKYI